MKINVLNIKTREEFRDWLKENHHKEKECYIIAKRGKSIPLDNIYYIDAVEEALCFGWIDSTVRVINNTTYQRFSPRRKNSNWTELNKERVRRLIKLNLMNESGLKVIPPLNEPFILDKDIEFELKKANAFDIFNTFPPLYQRVKTSNLSFYKLHYPKLYPQKLNIFIENTKNNRLYGDWNDYGRLLDY